MWMSRHRESTIVGSFSLRRISAEQLTEGHLADLRRMLQQDGASESEVLAWLERNLAHWAEHGFGIWILRDPASGLVLGRAGLRHVEVDHADEVEVAAAVLPEFRGRGLATDAARACVTIGRDWVGLRSMVGLTPPDDQASQRVLIKAALVYQRQVTYRELPHLLFRTD
jgi:RimJ/RimL family protein N-acetyltransferase